MTPLRLLGKIGRNLPTLSDNEWRLIFEFIEFYITTEKLLNTKEFEHISFDWAKIRDILMLLNKIT